MYHRRPRGKKVPRHDHSRAHELGHHELQLGQDSHRRTLLAHAKTPATDAGRTKPRSTKSQTDLVPLKSHPSAHQLHHGQKHLHRDQMPHHIVTGRHRESGVQQTLSNPDKGHIHQLSLSLPHRHRERDQGDFHAALHMVHIREFHSGHESGGAGTRRSYLYSRLG